MRNRPVLTIEAFAGSAARVNRYWRTVSRLPEINSMIVTGELDVNEAKAAAINLLNGWRVSSMDIRGYFCDWKFQLVATYGRRHPKRVIVA